MRIQHNISAMNSYRNYGNNNKSVGKNLEKISTGYRVNRAGDDAAGLAISEKMRIQITGLEQAQTNAKAGINLVQTAEGGLTEVHDMLKRMYTLAEQSANGTYDSETDRVQLQKEVAALRDEINRIADSTNYNGIKLLDGSLEDGGATGVNVLGNVKVSTSAGSRSSAAISLSDLSATNLTNLSNGGKIQLSLMDDKGRGYSVSLTKNSNGTVTDDNTGKVYVIGTSGTGSSTKTVTASQAKAIMEGAVNSATYGQFTVSFAGASGQLSMKSTGIGPNAPTIVGVGLATVTNGGTASVKQVTVKASYATASVKTLSIPSASVLSKGASADTGASAIFTINGQKFAVTSETSAKGIATVQATVGDDVTLLLGKNLGACAGQLAKATGLKVSQNKTDNTKVDIDTGSGRAMNMQIGDTAETFNRLNVNIRDCHAGALGIGGIDIGTQDGAAAAMSAIKDATNYVSDVRGTLGALQNRLDHTINNLATAEENITDAESTIRDTDIAKEMMAYTKNSILVQSAQAMLAQANQLPQGVLQLLG